MDLWPSLQDWLTALYIIAPLYCTNGAPVLFGGGTAVDFGRQLPDGERIFGDHKTVRGLTSGLAVGVIVGIFESFLSGTDMIGMAILASAGALLGDLGGAFIKRRIGIKPGQPLPGVDQLDFVLGAVLLVSLVYAPTMGVLLILFCVTPPIHLLANIGAYKLGLKSNYW
jgi:CDP-2,3-bis-(O-geranylgeranyl)-sn-glycerol synthase